MPRKSSRKSYVTFSNAARNGVAITGVEPDTWAAATTYRVHEMVKVDAAEDEIARCIEGHTSSASGLSISAGALSGADADNWELVPQNNFEGVVSWTVSSSDTENTITTSLNDLQDEQYSSQSADTITLAGQYNPDENLQKAFRKGNTGRIDIYPHGQGSGLPIWRASVRITSFDANSETAAPVPFTLNCAVTGTGINYDVTQT